MESMAARLGLGRAEEETEDDWEEMEYETPLAGRR